MTNLNELREKILEIDSKIIELLSIRQDTSKKIGVLKTKIGKEVFDPEREKKLMEYYWRLSQQYKIDPKFIKSLFQMIISHSKSVQKTL